MTVIESIVGSAGSTIQQKLSEEVDFLRGVRGQFEWLERELRGISRYLKDADAKAREGNDSIKAWVVEVIGVAYDADDAVTFFVWMEEQRRRRTFIDKCLFFGCDLLNLHKAGILIEAVKNNMEEISRSRSNFRLKEISGGESPEASSSRLQQYRNAITDFEEDLFVGFDHDMAALRDNLTKGETRRCVVSIVGMGGAGKTTLARKLYKDSNVKAHFGSNVAWVCVSQTYDIMELLEEIAEQMVGRKEEDSEEVSESKKRLLEILSKRKRGRAEREIQLREKLRELLEKLKYLIVVDDIWNKEAWDLLKGVFPNKEAGSRILLTTRNMDVASYADRQSQPHELRPLANEESWALFLNIVFPPMEEKNGKPSCPGQLEDVARQMVAKCGGLPLAVRVLGGLSFTTSDDATVWRKVLNHHLKWQLSSRTEHLNDILALSYLDLPDYLKPCFLYVGLFPEDSEISVEKLTWLWIAEGFIQAREESSMEDVAEQCVEELATRNMIQVICKSHSRFIFNRYFRVHDMLHALAIKEAKRVGLFTTCDDPLLVEDSSHVRRLGIHQNSSEENNRERLFQSGRGLPKVRSLLCFADRKFQLEGLERAEWLRVLSLTMEVSKLIEGDVIRLVHLKYLQMIGIKSLPPSIDKLYHLQTLDLGWSLVRLPEATWSLRRLRHLYASKASFEGRPQLKLLQHLHTLLLVAGEWIEGKSLIELSKLRNLGIFKVTSGVALEGFGEELIKGIQGMVHLQKLEISGSGRSVLPPFKSFNDNSQLEEIILNNVKIQEQPQISLEFPPNLARLVLYKTCLKDDPMSTLGKLKNLRLLTFDVNSYVGSKLSMPERAFPQLKSAKFRSLPNLEEWIVKEGAMPTLERLEVLNCVKLEMLPERLQVITTLKELIVRMPRKFLRQLEKNRGEDWHKIQHNDIAKTEERLGPPLGRVLRSRSRIRPRERLDL